MQDKFMMWWTMHIVIPVGALFLAHRVLKEEVQADEYDYAEA